MYCDKQRAILLSPLLGIVRSTLLTLCGCLFIFLHGCASVAIDEKVKVIDTPQRFQESTSYYVNGEIVGGNSLKISAYKIVNRQKQKRQVINTTTKYQKKPKDALVGLIVLPFSVADALTGNSFSTYTDTAKHETNWENVGDANSTTSPLAKCKVKIKLTAGSIRVKGDKSVVRTDNNGVALIRFVPSEKGGQIKLRNGHVSANQGERKLESGQIVVSLVDYSVTANVKFTVLEKIDDWNKETTDFKSETIFDIMTDKPDIGTPPSTRQESEPPFEQVSGQAPSEEDESGPVAPFEWRPPSKGKYTTVNE